MRSLGELVDRLSILNLKIWHIQDRVYDAAKKGVGLSAEDTKNLADLNLERAKTMTEIDECFALGLLEGKTTVEGRTKIT